MPGCSRSNNVLQEEDSSSASLTSLASSSLEMFIASSAATEHYNQGFEPPSIPQTYLALSLLVALFFNLPFGLLGACVSLTARRAYVSGRARAGDCRARWALTIDLLGMLVSALIVIVLVHLWLYRPTENDDTLTREENSTEGIIVNYRA